MRRGYALHTEVNFWNSCKHCHAIRYTSNVRRKLLFLNFPSVGDVIQRLLRVNGCFILVVRVLAGFAPDFEVLLDVCHPIASSDPRQDQLECTHICLSTSNVLVCCVKLFDRITRRVFASMSSSSLVMCSQFSARGLRRTWKIYALILLMSCSFPQPSLLTLLLWSFLLLFRVSLIQLCRIDTFSGLS